MFGVTFKKPGVLAAIGLVAILGIPITRWWWLENGKHPYERLDRERRAERAMMEALVPAARADLDCGDATVAMIGLEVWANGCGRRQRYVAESGGTWRREGEVVPEDKRPADRSGCRVRWKRGDEGTARDAASSALGEKKVARVRVPPASLGWAGFAKLRFGEWVESPIENAAGLDGLVMPCAVDGGGEATCAVPWDAVVEVSDCAS